MPRHARSVPPCFPSPRSRRSPKRSAIVVGGLTLAFAVGCGAADTSGDGGTTGGGDDGLQELPHHFVNCCFKGSFNAGQPNAAEHYGCQPDNARECIEPGEWDADESNVLEVDELQAFCEQKCATSWTAGLNAPPGWVYYDPGTWDIVGAPAGTDSFDGCVAMPVNYSLPAPQIKQDGYNKCSNESGYVQPYSDIYPLDVWPNYESYFSSGSTESELEIFVSSNELTPSSYALTVLFTLDNCDTNGIDGGTCRLVLSSFDLSMGRTTFDGYEVSAVRLNLNARVDAWVDFAPCDFWDGCVGTFEFSEDDDNALGTNLFWTQENLAEEWRDAAALHLSNGEGGLGGLEALIGVITFEGLEPGLRLVGYGEDSLGGDLASIDFDLVGSVSPWPATSP